ncbi:unnamed protein product [Ambrosiozyma monospora]|uniref:Unnamed protein product n=1 Tax=Ambrosiozyma monospora TaxID=43982 RepID=A0ACB5SY78_AMBMO|nr:unnamed protein product [Ambrosiozyma monospora]
MASSTVQDDADVHRSVARLSITEESNDERAKFLQSIKRKPSFSVPESESVFESPTNSPTKEQSSLAVTEESPTSGSSKSAECPFNFATLVNGNENGASRRKKNKKKKKGEKVDLELLTENAEIVPIKKQKRRRSSVLQSSQVRRKKFLSENPTFELYLTNEKNKKWSFTDLRVFIMSMLTDFRLYPHFCRVENRVSVDQVIFVFVPGLTSKDFGLTSLQEQMVPIKIEDTSCPDELDVLKKHFDYLVPLQAPE